MFTLICLLVLAALSATQAGPYGLRTGSNGYGNYQYQYPSTYNRNYYQQNYYQGYRSPYQYQGGYQNYYQSYARQPTYSNPVSTWNGINYDSAGNSYIGTKENGIYLFCNGRGCPGRG